MQIKKAELLAIAVNKEQYPSEDIPEIAFAGRSNVGKSSLINLLANRKKLAYTSGTPGKTRTINFYSINDDEFRIVDLPGYGYAKVSRSESQKWGGIIETYLQDRKNLTKVVQLVDMRHKPSVQDIQMHEWIEYYGFGGLIVATKADKVPKNQQRKNIREIQRALSLSDADKVIPVSALKKTGMDILLFEMEEIVQRGI